MRVSSISVAQPRNLNYKMRTANVKNVQTQPESMQPAFKGWKGSLGYLAGTVIGGTVGLGFVVKKLFFRKKKKYATVEPEGEYFRSR